MAAAVMALAPTPNHAAGLSYEVQTWDVDRATTGALVEDHRTPLIQLQIEFPVGTWSPWARENHAQEAWDIQIYDSKGALRARLDNLAVGLSAYVGQRSSVVSLTCRKDDFKDVLALVREILANRDFDRAELSRQKKGRQLDWEASLKTPDFVLQQAVHRLMFARDDPRRRPYEKPEAMLTDVRKLAEVRDVIVRLPGRVIGFAGDLTRAEAGSWARDLLPPAADQPPPGLFPRMLPLSSRESRPPEQTFSLPRLTQVYFAYARESLVLADPDKPAQMIADHVLGGHFYSRLSEALRHKEGDTYATGISESGSELAPGVYQAGSYTKTANAAATDQKLRQVVKEFFERGITEKERATAAGYLVGRRVFGRQAPGQVLAIFFWEHWQGVPRGFLDQLAERAAAVSLADVNAFIRRFHDPAQFTMIKVAPGK